MMHIEDAIKLLKEGKKMRCIGWEDGQWLQLVGKNLFKNEKDVMFYYGSSSMSWLFILESKWEIVDKE